MLQVRRRGWPNEDAASGDRFDARGEALPRANKVGTIHLGLHIGPFGTRFHGPKNGDMRHYLAIGTSLRVQYEPDCAARVLSAPPPYVAVRGLLRMVDAVFVFAMQGKRASI